MLYGVLSPITEVYHLCQKVIVVLLHLEIEGFRRQSFVLRVEDSLRPSGERLGPSERHGKHQLLLASLASVKRRSEQLLAFRRALLIELDGDVINDVKALTDRLRTLGHLCCCGKFGLEVRS